MAIVDFAFVTALTEEFEVLRNLLPQCQEKFEGANIWYRTRIEGSSGKAYEVVAAFQNQMGSLDAQLLTAQIIDRWDPSYIILIGIAGSFAKEVRLGDVIVSQQVFYYDLAKASSEGLSYRPQGYPSSGALIRQLESLRLDTQVFSGWREAARQSAAAKTKAIIGVPAIRIKAAKKALLTHAPEIHFGTIASGSQVIADKRKREELLRLHGKILGTEMEGAGVLHAAFFHKELTTPAIVIKGISDAADKKKERLDAVRFWRELAKENPARLAIELVRRGKIKPLATDEFIPDVRTGSPGEAREMIRSVSAPGTAYLAFPRIVMPKGPLTELHIRFETYGDHGELQVFRAVLEYAVRDGRRVREEVESANSIDIDHTIFGSTIGLYLMLSASPTKIIFKIWSYGPEQEVQWKPEEGARYYAT